MRFRSWSVYAVTLIGLGLCALAAGQQEPAAPTATPRVEVSSQLWDFGEAWEGEVLEYQVTVKNVGDAPLIIKDVKRDCGCTVPTRPKSPLAPGESDRMGIRLETKGKSGNLNYPVTLVTNDPRRENVIIRVQGHVSYLFDINPVRSLAFGSLYPDSAESRSVELISKYPGGVPLKLKEDQDFGMYAVELKELEPGLRYKLTATSRPPLKLGMTAGRRVTLLTGLTFIPEIPVGISASVQPLVRVRPNRLFLPTKSVVEMRQTLRVEYAPHYPVTVREVKATHDAIKVELRRAPGPGARPNPHRHEIVVLLPPGDRIPPEAQPQIEIVTDAKDPAYQKLVVPVQMISPRPRPARPQPGPAGRSAPAGGVAQPSPTSQPASKGGS
jgi:hypothetical protein